MVTLYLLSGRDQGRGKTNRLVLVYRSKSSNQPFNFPLVGGGAKNNALLLISRKLSLFILVNSDVNPYQLDADALNKSVISIF